MQLAQAMNGTEERQWSAPAERKRPSVAVANKTLLPRQWALASLHAA